MTNKLRRSPLQLPVNSAEFLRTFVFDRAPTTADFKNFKISDLWIHRNPSGLPPYGYFVLVDKPTQTGIWINLGGKQSGDIQSLTGDSGGAILPDVNGNVDLLGGIGITTVGSGNSITINGSLSGLDWTVDTTTPINVNVGEGHIANGGGQIVYNLPSSPLVGEGFAFLDLGGNGFQVQAGAGQSMRSGNQVSAVAGSLTSTDIGDGIFFICVVASLTFLTYSSQGNFTII